MDNLCINIGDVHQLVGHCLIPLDPKVFRELKETLKNLGGMHMVFSGGVNLGNE